MRYDLQSNQLKESVIIKQAKDTLAGYKYTLAAPGMVLELQDDNSILAYAADAEEGDEPIFYMPAPFLVDDNLAYNDNITVSLQQSRDTYTLTYSLPRAWLLDEERAYPVVLDPVVQPKSGIYTISDQTVFSNATKSHTWACLAVGHSTSLGIARALIKFRNLPVLTSADVIVSASINIKKYTTSSVAHIMEAHRVKETWESWDVTWADMKTPDDAWDSKVEDYNQIKAAGWCSWDITNIAQQWYASGQNTGVLFKLSDSSENTSAATLREFYASDWGGSVMPTLQISYLNNCGLEDYWDYTSQSAGRAGTGYVSNFTGNLTWVHNGLSFAGNRMPVSISHVYSANDSNNSSDNDNDNDYDYGLGYGWRTNYNQRVYPWAEDSSYYVWEDQDGTRRYFLKTDLSWKYENEIDNTLVLTTRGSGDKKYCITDKDGNQKFFDTNGRLTMICNDRVTFSSIKIAYSGTTNRITSVTDGANRVYTFNYNDSGLLSSIVFKGTGATAISTLTYAYDSSSNLTCITYPDGNSVYYCYNRNHEDVALTECAAGNCGGTGAENHLLHRAFDADGYRVEYAYTASSPHRITHIAEFDGSTAGGSLDIEYAHNQTTFVDHNGNKEIVQFNNFGSTVSIQDGLGRAQFAQYVSDGDIKSASQLSLSSKLQNTVVDLMRNGGFETNGYWNTFSESATTGSAGYTTAQTYLGAKAMQITRTEEDAGYHVYSTADSVYTAQPGKPYTLSAYVKTADMDGSGDGAKIALKLSNSGTVVATSEAIKVNSDWTRLEVTYNHPEDAEEDLLVVMLYNDSVGTAYFDCTQLEQSASASRYNLVENGDFSRQKTTATDAYNWLEGSECYGTENRILYTGDPNDPNVEVTAAPQMDNYVYTVTGSPTLQKRSYQDLLVSGSAGDVYTLAGWAKGDSVPLTNGTGRRFGLILRFYGTGGTQKETLINFNPDTDSALSWQYAAGRIVAPIDYSYIRVLVVYEDNMNTVYFDGIQLFKEEFGQSYVYDANGNVISVTDLQQQKATYEYTDNQLTKAVLPNGVIEEYTYYRDDLDTNKPLVASITTSTGVVANFAYDDYGNNTRVTVTADGKTLTATAGYTNNSNYLASITDPLGKTTTYGYNTQTGVLEWVQAPGEDESTRTEYTYDNLYRTTKVDKADASVTYAYTTDLLDTITSASGTVYDFAYTTFDLVQSVKAGSRTLISHEYSASPNFYLTKSTYGNGDHISYAYDNYGRTTSKTYEDGDIISYAYDNNGNLGLVTDSASGRTTKYLYDFQDRLSRYEEVGTGYSSSVEWGYDTKNNLTSQTHTLNGTEYLTEYAYNDDNQLTFVTMEDHAMRYDYDAFGRLTVIRGTTPDGAGVEDPDFDASFWPNISIQYTEPSSTSTSTQISEWLICDDLGVGMDGYYYTYDDRGNITDIYSDYAGYHISYTYDELGQLTYEHYTDYTIVYDQSYTYDDGGNILTKTVHPIEMYSLNSSSPGTITYTYGDATWKDLLTAINGQPLTYDGIGNLTDDGTWEYEWEHGRQLASMESDDTAISYAYNADGLRISKTVDGTVYHYHYVGDQLAGMTWGDNQMYFYYDALGPIALNYNGEFYFYIRNAQGDIIHIADEEYSFVVSYVYDAWGNPLTTTGSMASTLGALNPLRYRGYVYDQETGLYYLQSRYYNPAWGRFINADEYVATGQSLLGNNAFTYCYNNPVNCVDKSGDLPVATIVAIAVGVINAGSTLAGDLLYASATGEPINWTRTGFKTAANGIFSALGSRFKKIDKAVSAAKAVYAFGETLYFTGSFTSAANAFASTVAMDKVAGSLGDTGTNLWGTSGEVAGNFAAGYFSTGTGIYQNGFEAAMRWAKQKMVGYFNSFNKPDPFSPLCHSQPTYSAYYDVDIWTLPAWARY